MSAPGTINDVLNPVDWTKLKSVPAGFADGVDDVGSGGGWVDDGSVVRLENSFDKVGIGTSDPYGNLQIGDYPTMRQIFTSWLHEFSTTGYSGISMNLFQVDGEPTVLRYRLGGFEGSHLNLSGGRYNFSTAPAGDADSSIASMTSRLFIENTGDVGIGTTDPGEKLEVAGTIYSTSGGFRFPDSTIQTTAGGGGGDNHSLDAADGDPDDIVYVDNDGKVGIRTTNPYEQLHIRRFASGEPVLLLESMMATGADAHMRFWDSNENYSYALGIDDTGNKLKISYQADSTAAPGVGDLLTVTMDGNVGIGTNNPDVPLHVSIGSDASIDSGGNLVSGSVTSENIVIDANENMARDNGAISPLYLNKNGGNVFLCEDSGSVGIGIINPEARLHVDGAIRFETATRNFQIQQVEPSDPQGWSSLLNLYGGIGIGADAGTNRQMVMLTDGSSTDNVFTIASSQNDGSSWEADFVVQQNGYVGIGTLDPDVPLHVSIGSDVSLAGGGNLVSGPVTTLNIAIDANEIMARDNGAISTLYLNKNGGDVILCEDSSVVGIRTSSPDPDYALDVNGDVSVQSIYISSDSRLKRNVTRIEDALGIVSRLRGVRFDWRDDEFPEKNLDGGRKIGLIAQEVEEVLPEVVSSPEDGYKSLEYANLVAVLVEAVKELETRNSTLEARLDELENRAPAGNR